MKPRKRKLIVVDLYCGAGGIDHSLVEYCAEMGYELDLTCVNHWDKAIATNKKNHPNAKHLCMSVEQVDPLTAVPGGKLDLLILAPQCIYFTRARGGKPVTDQMRVDAWQVMRWIQALHVKTILLENVVEFMDWGPTKKKKVTRNVTFTLPLSSFRQFRKKYGSHGGYRAEWLRVYKQLRRMRTRAAKVKLPVHLTIDAPDPDRKGEIFHSWVAAIRAHGYNVKYQAMNSADYGAYTSRKRFFLIARKKTSKQKIEFPMPSHSPTGKSNFSGKMEKYRAAAEIIDWSDLGTSIWNRERAIVHNTWMRVLAGLDRCSGITFLGVDGDTRPRSQDEIAAMLMKKEAGTPVNPFLISLRGTGAGALESSNFGADGPVPTLTGGNHVYVVNPLVLAIRGGDDGYTRAIPVSDPLGSPTTSNPMAVLSPALEPFSIPFFGEREGKSPRYHPIREPLPSPTSHGAGAVVLTVPYLVEFHNTGVGAQPVTEPVPSQTTRDRFALINPIIVKSTDGNLWLFDILMRMLKPRELARAMSFPEQFEFVGSREQVVKQIGNAIEGRLGKKLIHSALCLRLRKPKSGTARARK